MKVLELEMDNNDYKITGVEEFYAEPPMIPKEAMEEEPIYDPKLSIATYLAPAPHSNFF